MDASRAMVQFIFWTVFIVAVLSVIAAWYLLVGLAALGIAIAAYWVRKRNAQKALLAVSPVEDGKLSVEQSKAAASAGQLQLPEGNELRVVESLQYRGNHQRLGAKYQVEKAETLVVEGVILAGTVWLEDLDEGTEKEVLFVTSGDMVLGQLADVDLADWYDEILEVGGAAKCNLSVTFASDLSISSIRVRGFNDAL
jgi:hypothetical protein